MRIVTHGAGGADKLLRVETEGCAVHITIGLHDADGREFTSIEIEPLQPADNSDQGIGDTAEAESADGQTRPVTDVCDRVGRGVHHLADARHARHRPATNSAAGVPDATALRPRSIFRGASIDNIPATRPERS